MTIEQRPALKPTVHIDSVPDLRAVGPAPSGREAKRPGPGLALAAAAAVLAGTGLALSAAPAVGGLLDCERSPARADTR